MIDIREEREIIEIINSILNNGGVAEIKNESRTSIPNLVVVEIERKVKTKKRK